MEICLLEERKFFFWLVLKNRLSTRSLLRRCNTHLQDYNCVFCLLNVEEDLLHLFFHCPFSQACWFSLNVFLPNSDDILDIVDNIKHQLNQTFFMEIIVTMCWAIWIMRNDIIFRNLAHSVQRCRSVFKKEFALVILRAKTSLHPRIVSWLEAFV